MIVDALYYANPVFKFEENIFKPEKYINYTDNILSLIEISSDPLLKQS